MNPMILADSAVALLITFLYTDFLLGGKYGSIVHLTLTLTSCSKEPSFRVLVSDSPPPDSHTLFGLNLCQASLAAALPPFPWDKFSNSTLYWTGKALDGRKQNYPVCLVDDYHGEWHSFVFARGAKSSIRSPSRFVGKHRSCRKWVASVEYCDILLTSCADATVVSKPSAKHSSSFAMDNILGPMDSPLRDSVLDVGAVSNVKVSPKPLVSEPICFAREAFAAPVCALSSDCETGLETTGSVKASSVPSQPRENGLLGSRTTHDSDISFLKQAVRDLPLLALLGSAIILMFAAACDVRKHVSCPVR